ncbi:glucosamine--fructose-6-phosphate aminotransferase [Actinomycetes bacterium]|nr:glucosamine--fructose-6-phosphate aminotransferase [Actinomycetes bacterium]
MSRFQLIENAPYFADIQAQPEAVQKLVSADVPLATRTLLDEMANFDRIILTGMGSSLNALYPSYLRLVSAGFPVWHEDTAELLINIKGRIKGRTLFWIASQSGESAEVVQLLNELESIKGDVTILGFTNYPASNLGSRSNFLFNILCGPENTVSAKSYVNTLLAAGMATSVALSEEIDPEIFKLSKILRTYLENWEKCYEALDSAIAQKRIFIIGRGESMAAARTGSLIIKEAAREGLESLTTAQFRHGPLEMASEDVAVLIFDGYDDLRSLNSSMYKDLIKLKANPIWISAEAHPLYPGISAPPLTSQLTRPVSEVIVMQILTLVLANRKGDEPGKFRQISKITTIL